MEEANRKHHHGDYTGQALPKQGTGEVSLAYFVCLCFRFFTCLNQCLLLFDAKTTQTV